MGWYSVTKTIKGRKYHYLQRTYRAAGHVKTENRYVGPVGDDMSPAERAFTDQYVAERVTPAPIPQHQKLLDHVISKIGKPTAYTVSTMPSGEPGKIWITFWRGQVFLRMKPEDAKSEYGIADPHSLGTALDLREKPAPWIILPSKTQVYGSLEEAAHWHNKHTEDMTRQIETLARLKADAKKEGRKLGIRARALSADIRYAQKSIRRCKEDILFFESQVTTTDKLPTSYEIKSTPPRMVKDAFVVFTKADTNSFSKGDAAKIVEILGGRYSGREKGYILPNAKRDVFERAVQLVESGKLEAPPYQNLSDTATKNLWRAKLRHLVKNISVTTTAAPEEPMPLAEARIATELEPLAAEARKYGSAEEFHDALFPDHDGKNARFKPQFDALRAENKDIIQEMLAQYSGKDFVDRDKISRTIIANFYNRATGTTTTTDELAASYPKEPRPFAEEEEVTTTKDDPAEAEQEIPF